MANRYQRRKLATDAPEGYQRSRAANRELYGTRSIDASAPLSPRSGTGAGVGERPMKGGLTPETSWRGFFDRPAPLVGSPALVGASKEWTDPMKAWGPPKTDPSKAFQMAGAPPTGGPVTERSALTQMGMNVPMPTTPTAMQYYQEGIKGAQPFVPGAFREGDSFSDTRYGSPGKPGTASARNETMREFFDRYLKRRG